MHTHMHTHAHTCTHTCTLACTDLRIHTCAHTHARIIVMQIQRRKHASVAWSKLTSDNTPLPSSGPGIGLVAHKQRRSRAAHELPRARNHIYRGDLLLLPPFYVTICFTETDSEISVEGTVIIPTSIPCLETRESPYSIFPNVLRFFFSRGT